MVPFASTFRARSTVLRLAPPGAAVLAVRVEVPEVWDVVRVEAEPAERLVALKRRVLAVLYPDAISPDDFVLKLSGCEILNEEASLAEAGAVDGSIFLLTFRRRRPVR